MQRRGRRCDIEAREQRGDVRVSSQAITAHARRASSERGLASARLPIGVRRCTGCRAQARVNALRSRSVKRT
jgi:hypothetical protein